ALTFHGTSERPEVWRRIASAELPTVAIRRTPRPRYGVGRRTKTSSPTSSVIKSTAPSRGPEYPFRVAATRLSKFPMWEYTANRGLTFVKPSPALTRRLDSEVILH